MALLALAGWRPGVAGPIIPDTNDDREVSIAPDAKPAPVVLELFPSEGWPSRPPANRVRAIRGASQAAKPGVQLSWEKDDTRVIPVEPLDNTVERDRQQVLLAVAENRLHSDVRPGENVGRALEHNGVVRQPLPLSKIDAAQAGFTSRVAVHSCREWNPANLCVLVFVQELGSRRIPAVAAIASPATLSGPE